MRTPIFRQVHGIVFPSVMALLLCAIITAGMISDTRADTCCNGTVGNVDCSADETPGLGDLTAMIEELFVSPGSLCCEAEANLDTHPGVTLGDLTVLIDHLFISFAPLRSCPGPAGHLVSMDSCHVPAAKYVVADTIVYGCVQWTYDQAEKALYLTHVNAGFNCCPELAFTVEVDPDAGSIVIDELEIEGICDCLCLFDLDFVVENLPVGTYELSITEPYLETPPEEPIVLTLDLSQETSGEFCLPRYHYPWLWWAE